MRFQGIDAGDADSGSESHVSERQFHCAATSFKERNDVATSTFLVYRSALTIETFSAQDLPSWVVVRMPLRLSGSPPPLQIPKAQTAGFFHCL